MILGYSKEHFWDIFWQLFGAIMNRGAFFCAMILLSYQLSLKEYGELGFLLLIVNSVSAVIVTPIGINIRNELQEIDIKHRYDHLAISINLLYLLTIFFGILVISYSVFVLNTSLDFIDFFLLILYLILLSSFTFLNYFFAGIGDFKSFNIRSSFGGILLLISIVFLRLDSVKEVLIIFILTMFVSILFTIPFSQLKVFYKIKSKDTLLSYFRDRKEVFIPVFLQSVVNLPIVGFVQGLIIYFDGNFELIGLITFSNQIINLVSIVINKVNSVGIVYLNQIKKNSNQFYSKVKKEILLIILISFSGTIFLALVLFFNKERLSREISQSLPEISFYLAINVFTYIYWYLQEVNILMNKNWRVFYINCIWALTVITLSFLTLVLSGTMNLYSYSLIVIGTRLLLIFFLSKIFTHVKKEII
ncbi:MAG TPA: hypothetical protein PLI97_02380 [Fluviicola sp.]|nr:hypothetical protein [Fluviicola sp.]